MEYLDLFAQAAKNNENKIITKYRKKQYACFNSISFT